MTKEILIVENEEVYVRGIFDLFNILKCNGELNFTFRTSSQDLEPLEENIPQYDFIFVDLSLSERSDVGGSTFIETITKLDSCPGIAIITGKTRPEDLLKKKNLSHIPLIKKPIKKDEHFQVMYDLIFK